MFLIVFLLCVKTVSTIVKIIPDDGFQVLQKGSKYTITCISEGSPISEVYWVDNFDIKVIYSDPSNRSTVYYTKTKEKNVLNFASINHDDEGQYKCFDKNEQKATYNIYVYEPIKLLSPSTQYLKLGTEEDSVECQAYAYPHPSILSWSHNGKQLTYGKKYKEVRGKSLLVKDVRKSDTGVYGCEVSLGLVYNHSRTFSIKVIVQKAPEIEKWPVEQMIREGTSLSLQCKVDMESCPYNVTFYLNDKALKKSDRISLSTDGCSNGGVSTVFILLALRTDNGVLRCEAENHVGEDEQAVNVSVVVTPKILSFKNISCIKGTECLLVCVYEGNVLPNITYHGQSIASTAETKNGKATLRIHADKPGKHECFVSSEFGKDNAEAYVDITYKPYALEDQMKEVHTWEGQVRNITCKVKSNPAPEVNWIVRKKTVKESKDYQDILQQHPIVSLGDDVYFSVLTVRYTDNRWYTLFNTMVCSVVNEVGATNISVNITRAMIPGQPSVKISRYFPGEVWLVVEPSEFTGFIPLIGVHVDVVNKDGIFVNRFNFTLDDERKRVRGLRAQSSYTLRVSSFNARGNGEVREISVTTRNATKPEPVELISASTSNKTWYDVRWSSPIEVGLPIKHVVRHRKVAGLSVLKEPLEDWVRQSTTANHHNITNLPSNCTIQVDLIAINGLGSSNKHEDFYVYIDYETESHFAMVDKVLSFTVPSISQASTLQRQSRNVLIGILTIFLLVVVFAFLIDATCYYQRGTSLIYHRLISSKQPNKVSHKEDDQASHQQEEKNNLINLHRNETSSNGNNTNINISNNTNNNNNDKSFIVSSYSTSTYRSENVTSTPRDTSVDCGTFDGSVRS